MYDKNGYNVWTMENLSDRNTFLDVYYDNDNWQYTIFTLYQDANDEMGKL